LDAVRQGPRSDCPIREDDERAANMKQKRWERPLRREITHGEAEVAAL
jgi:hypothetical protein